MAFTTTPYTTLSDVKLRLDLTNADNDTLLSELISSAQSFIDRRIGYSFQTDGTLQAPATRTYSGQNTATLMIDDCTTLTQVIESYPNTYLGANGVWVSGTASNVDITADVVLGPNNMTPGFLLSRISGNLFYTGRQNYTVKGIFGYASVPPEIAHACARIVVHWYKMRDTNYTDTIAEQGFVRMRFQKKLPDDVVEIIDSYRKHLTLSSWGQ